MKITPQKARFLTENVTVTTCSSWLLSKRRKDGNIGWNNDFDYQWFDFLCIFTLTNLCGDILSRFHVFCRETWSVFNKNVIGTKPQIRVLHSDFESHAAMSRAISGNGNTTTKNVWMTQKYMRKYLVVREKSCIFASAKGKKWGAWWQGCDKNTVTTSSHRLGDLTTSLWRPHNNTGGIRTRPAAVDEGWMFND